VSAFCATFQKPPGTAPQLPVKKAAHALGSARLSPLLKMRPAKMAMAMPIGMCASTPFEDLAAELLRAGDLERAIVEEKEGSLVDASCNMR